MVHWCVAVSASAVGLMFTGNYVIVGGDPSMVELLVGPVSGGIRFHNCMSVPSGGELVGVSFITTHNGGVPSTESGLIFPLVLQWRRLIMLQIASVKVEMGGCSFGSS